MEIVKENRRIIKQYFFLLLLYKLLYDYISIEYIIGLMQIDRGVYYYNVDGLKYFVASICFLLNSVTIIPYIRSPKVSANIIIGLFLFYYIPTLTQFTINDKLGVDYLVLIHLYWWAITISYRLIRPIKIMNLGMISNFKIVTLILFIYIFIFVYNINGLSISFDLSDVYDMRENNHDLPIIFSWLKGGISLIAAPVAIVYFLLRKQYIYFSIFVVMQLLFFSVAMDKIILFLLFISIGWGIFKVKTISITMTKAILSIFVISLVEVLLCKTNLLIYFLIRRIFFVPTWMNSIYYDFFCKNEKLYFGSDTFLISKIIPSSYRQGVLDLINHTYFFGEMPSPNTGLFAEGYMHLGILGLIFIPLLFVFMLRIIDVFTLFLPINCRLIYTFSFLTIVVNIPITGGYFAAMFIVSTLLIAIMNNYSLKQEYYENLSFRTI